MTTGHGGAALNLRATILREDKDALRKLATAIELMDAYKGRGVTDTQAELARERALVDAAMSEAENLARDVGASQYGGIPHFVIAYGRLRTVIEGAVTAALQSEREAAAAEARRALLDCALYDALMEGPKFKGWNRSALDRLRLQYEAAALASPAPQEER